MQLIKDEHMNRLPTVRLVKAVLNNFKSVEHGEIVFDCGKKFIPYGTKSDILGIYGQNGSGKTSIIEALSILASLLRGRRVPDVYSECVGMYTDHSELEFTFELQYPVSDEHPEICVRKVCYKFSMASVEKPVDKGDTYQDVDIDIDDDDEILTIDKMETRVRIYDEVISIGGDIDGQRKKIADVIDTSTTKGPFGPTTKRSFFIDKDAVSLLDLEINKRLASERSKSFIFMNETLETFAKRQEHTPYFEVLLELNYYARYYFFVVDTKSAGMIRLNFALPIYTRRGVLPVDSRAPMVMGETSYEHFKVEIENINSVLTQLVPGLAISVKNLGPKLLKNGAPGTVCDVVAIRNGSELPLRDESDGIRKIISVLSLISSAYNDRSMTVAIDEFDAGIFEYLLGEILQTFEESGKGQFIFTSHNLRPLEVIDKKFLYFTTTNPKNRYIHLKNIGASNNLRSTYYREILIGEQDEEIYKATKKHKIVAALRKAGR